MNTWAITTASRALAATVLAATTLLLLAACSAPDDATGDSASPADTSLADADQGEHDGHDPGTARFPGFKPLTMPAATISADPAANAARNAYFGDLHVHTDYSFDAFAFGTVATPYDAYRYAKGEAILHPAGFEVQLRQPLDFYAVTDHAMFLGAVKAAANTSTAMSRLDHVQGLHNMNDPANLTVASLPARIAAFTEFLPKTLAGIANGSIDVEMINNIARDAWADTVVAAQNHYQPGRFTTFVAYEYTSSSDDRGNLHRNVIFQDADKLPAMPFSRFHSQNPEGLWDWMDDLRNQGIESLAIPHNSNGSNGQMFKLVDWAGNPLTDTYAKQRVRNEPLVEITQIKGTSETHPVLSDNDEWANFEIMPFRVATTLPSAPNGSYARQALVNGLMFADQGISNPYQFGFVGASDTHTGAASIEEDNYFSKAGLIDGDGQRRGSVPLTEAMAEITRTTGRVDVKSVDGNDYVSGGYETWGASGLTGVWAEDNTREAIYRAFRRKETFATSGPRIRVRLLAGYGFDQSLFTAADPMAEAYRRGVSMGSELAADGNRAPGFLAWATRDANSAALQRLQIVKGWTLDGEPHEQVYDVACSDAGTVDPASHRCPDNGATVDMSDCSVSARLGAAELKTVWQDPDFDPGQRAFYYVRVLENPTCRWSTWDALRAGTAPRPDLHATIQERAWSSPIWYLP